MGEPWRAHILRGWANQVAARFAAPVYLVGSALFEEDPRDVDIVVILPDAAFAARYESCGDFQALGSQVSEGARRWAADVAKIGGQLALFHRMNVDFKIQPQSHADRFYDGWRLRIDSVELVDEATIERRALILDVLLDGWPCTINRSDLLDELECATEAEHRIAAASLGSDLEALSRAGLVESEDGQWRTAPEFEGKAYELGMRLLASGMVPR